MITKVKSLLRAIQNACERIIPYGWFPPLSLFLVAITIFWFVGGFEDALNWKVDFWFKLDTSLSIALSIFVVWAYMQYARDKNKQHKFTASLESIDLTHAPKDGVLIVQFGGSNPNAAQEIRSFIKENTNIPDHFILIKVMGDENNNVNEKDVSKLKEWLTKECMQQLAHVEKIHIFVSGAGIAFAVVSDILNNWKTLIFYHYQDGTYKRWYQNKKSEEKIDHDNPIKVKPNDSL
ncbi:MAG: hypothetical protein K6347_02415 [Campylobacterales bacterium]